MYVSSIIFREPGIGYLYSVLLARPSEVVDLQCPGALAPPDHPGLSGGQAPGQGALLLPARLQHQVRGARKHRAESSMIAYKY